MNGLSMPVFLCIVEHMQSLVMEVRAGRFFIVPRLHLQDRRMRVPVVRYLRMLGGFVSGDGALGANSEMNPAVAVRAAANEPGVVPPGSDQGVMNGPSVILQAEINRLHWLSAADVRTGGLGVDDVRSHLTLLAHAVCYGKQIPRKRQNRADSVPTLESTS
jgi:hypothetical protein